MPKQPHFESSKFIYSRNQYMITDGMVDVVVPKNEIVFYPPETLEGSTTISKNNFSFFWRTMLTILFGIMSLFVLGTNFRIKMEARE